MQRKTFSRRLPLRPRLSPQQCRPTRKTFSRGHQAGVRSRPLLGNRNKAKRMYAVATPIFQHFAPKT